MTRSSPATSALHHPAAHAVGRLVMASGLERDRGRASWAAVVFHHLTDGERWAADDPHVAGLGVDISVDRFVDRIDHLEHRYEIVDLDRALSGDGAAGDGRKRVLICFDDAYASVAELAAPVLAARGLPWCFFINPGLVGNRTLALDNVVAYVWNTCGPAPLERVLGRPVHDIGDLLRGPLAARSPIDRARYLADVADAVGLDVAAAAARAGLYLDERDVRALAEAGVEIGNHTADHVSCRVLDAQGAEEQVVASAATIHQMSGRAVRAFAYPYGSADDVTPVVADAVRRSGHACAFLVEGLENHRGSDPYRLHRIHLAGSDDPTNALELALLPRLRALRSRTAGSRRR